MPELPDLQVFTKNLQKKLAGKKLVKIDLVKAAKSNASNKVLKAKLEKQKLLNVLREGKELRLEFKNKNTLGLHMMLRGRLTWYDDQVPKHSLMQMNFEKNLNLALTDYQRNARITLNPEPSDAPDALSADTNVSFWKKALQSKATIKNLLLDQKIVRGIGNAYADEILWQAGISPFSVSKNIPPAKVTMLSKAVKQVLKNAEKQIDKTAPGIIGGEIRDFLLIHNASRKSSPKGAVIRKKMVGGRKTYYTEEQEEF